MPNLYVNKVDINGSTVIDLTGDTITAAKLERGFTAHDATGAPITGTGEVGIDGDNLAYGVVAQVGSALVGYAYATEV